MSRPCASRAIRLANSSRTLRKVSGLISTVASDSRSDSANHSTRSIRAPILPPRRTPPVRTTADGTLTIPDSSTPPLATTRPTSAAHGKAPSSAPRERRLPTTRPSSRRTRSAGRIATGSSRSFTFTRSAVGSAVTTEACTRFGPSTAGARTRTWSPGLRAEMSGATASATTAGHARQRPAIRTRRPSSGAHAMAPTFPDSLAPRLRS